MVPAHDQLPRHQPGLQPDHTKPLSDPQAAVQGEGGGEL